MARDTEATIKDWLARHGYASDDPLPRDDVRRLLDDTGFAARTRSYGPEPVAGVAPDNHFILVADGARVADINSAAATALSLQPLLNREDDLFERLGPAAVLVDDRVVLYRSWHAPGSWSVTVAAEVVDAARRVFAELDTLRARGTNQPPSPLAIEAAPLADMAAFALAEAPARCADDGHGGRLCDWYHGLWPTLRLFGMAATPERHAAFFHDVFSEAANAGGFGRALVCGTADYAMPALVHQVYGQCGRTPDLTVLDLCPTPLALCTRFARQVGVSWQTIARDALAPGGATYDLICSHSFLSRFDAQTRPLLMTRWHDALRPGGRVVTTTRLDPDWAPADVGLSDSQIDSLVNQVSQRVERWRRVLPIDSDTVVALARRYAENLYSYAVRSEDELRALFSGAGLRIVRLDVKEVRGGSGGGRKGMPGLVKSARYADIVAERPSR